MTPDISSLMASADAWEKGEYAASVIVLVGIVFESYELYQHARQGRLREKAIEAAAALVVVLGLAAELLTTAMSNNRTGLVIGLLNAEAEGAKNESAKATKAAADLGVTVDNLTQVAQQKAAQANIAIAALQEATANATAKVDVIGRTVASRVIHPNQLATVQAAISKFAGMPIDVFVVGESSDESGLVDAVNTLLVGAHWQPVTWAWSGTGPFAGADIFIKPGASVDAVAAANSLSAALRNTDLPADALPWPGEWKTFGGMLTGPTFSADRSQIRLVIGPKKQ